MTGEESHKIETVSIDWIAGTTPREMNLKLLNYLTEICGGHEPISRNYGQYRYDRSYHWEGHGITLHHDSTLSRAEQVHAGRSLLVITGSGMRLLSPGDKFNLVKNLVGEFWLKCTRLDCCFDDFTKRKTPTEVFEECCTNQKKFTRFRRCSHTLDVDSKLRPVGDMVTWGQRGEMGSGAYLRYYRKDLESKGVTNSYRWEIEFSQTKAQEAFYALFKMKTVEDFQSLVASYVGGSIDFVDRKDKNLKRATRLEWWARILKHLGESRLVGKSLPPDVEKSREWVKKSVVGSLSLIEAAIGVENFREWLTRLVENHQLTERQQISLEHYRMREAEREELRVVS